MQSCRYLLHFGGSNCKVVAICYTFEVLTAKLSLFATLGGLLARIAFRLDWPPWLHQTVFLRFCNVFSTFFLMEGKAGKFPGATQPF